MDLAQYTAMHPGLPRMFVALLLLMSVTEAEYGRLVIAPSKYHRWVTKGSDGAVGNGSESPITLVHLHHQHRS